MVRFTLTGLIRNENGALRKALPPNRRNLKTLAFRFRVNGKHFHVTIVTCHDSHVTSLTEFSSNINPKWPMTVALLNFSDVLWTENIYLARFQCFKIPMA